MLLSSVDALIQAMENSPGGPPLFDFSIGIGSDRLIENLNGSPALHSVVPRLGSPREDLARRRLRLKGLICRKARSHSCELTPYGRDISLFLSRVYQRVLRPGLAAAAEPPWKVEPQSS